jgi:hypothetical protein
MYIYAKYVIQKNRIETWCRFIEHNPHRRISLAFPHYPRPRGTEPRTQKELESVHKEGEMPKKGERPQNEQGRFGINQPPARFRLFVLDNKTIAHLLI